ncbi:unnamed protein product [Candida verbasci]|uniref:Bud site selection protein 21 n=1 Tax=Candida verbasci TaxID=1227364 RepID=A0A9W4TVK8_9ASCO|nr:unnamed protein product [Candida verbasci]
MVLTRSQAHELRKPKKIKFDGDEDDIIEKELSVDDVEENEKEDEEKENAEEEDEEDDDSDEAPEMESTSKSKNEIIAREREAELQQQELKRLEKEKRKSLDKRNKQQQELKRKQKQELPEFLPDNIESIINADNVKEESEEDVVVVPKNKHFKLDDDRLSKLEEKLRQIKQDKKKAQIIRKGPVHVAVLDKKPLVPKSEYKILKNKDKWLNRKSINRK